MAKVDGSLSSLIQGVSQQPDREKLPGQCILQENLSSNPVEGLTRRGPLEYITTLIDDAHTYTFLEHDGEDSGQYVLAYREDDIKMFGLDGTQYTVIEEDDALDYLSSGDSEIIGVLDGDDSTLEDIYILNKDKVVAMLPDTPSYIEHGCLAFLLGGQYGRDYSITLKWTDSLDTEYTETVTTSTPDGSSASHIEDIATDKIAEALYNLLNANTNVTDDFDVFRESDVIYITKEDAADVVTYSIEISDGDGGANMFAVNNKVNDVGDLPRYAPQGYIVKVEESGTADADDWYLQFIVDSEEEVTNGEGFGTSGVWAEAAAPGVEFKLDKSTMPHVLEKTGATEFTFKQGDWQDRTVGDNTTVPLPSFVGSTIEDISAFQGRLTLLSSVNCVMSRTNKPTDFFNQSATTLNDDDPLDFSSALGAFKLKRAVPHNRDLIVFSNEAQFIVFGRNQLTPKNSSLVLTTEYKANLNAKAVGAGRNIFFATDYGNYTGVREFFTEGSQDINNARPITSHVLKYIQGSAVQLASSLNFDKLIVRTDANEKELYVYEYVWLDNQKVQSSWSKWLFNKDVKHIFFINSLLYVIVQDGTKKEMYSMNLDNTEDAGVTYRVHLDERITRDSVTTTFTVPYDIDDIDNYVVVQGDGCPYPGMRALIDSYSSGTVTLKDDMGGGSVYFGRKFMSKYVPQSANVKDRDGNKIGTGKLVIKQFYVHFEDTGYIKAEVTDDYGYSATREFTGRVLGSPSNLVGQPALSDGVFQVPYKKNVDTSQLTLSTDSHLPMSLLELEWVGQWTKKGRRITGG